MPCSLLSLDVQDVMGSHELDTKGTLYKMTIDVDGKILLSVFTRVKKILIFVITCNTVIAVQ